MYKAAIQNISSIFDKDSQDKKLVIVSYYGSFKTNEEANLFAKHSRIGIRKKKELIEENNKGKQSNSDVFGLSRISSEYLCINK